MGERAGREAVRRPEKTADAAPDRARDRAPEVRRRTASRVVGTHDVATVAVGPTPPVRLWRVSPDRHEREARSVGPTLVRGRGGVVDRPPGLVARRAPRPDPALGGGRTLSAGERQRYEASLGVDVSAVRVHDGLAAKRAAAARKAHAFTFGNHVVLGRAAQVGGPGPRAAVLAHELVHVRQQALPSRLAGAGSARGPPAGVGGQVTCAPLGVQCWEAGDLVPGFVSDAAGAVADVGSAAVGAVAEAGEAAFDWVLDGVRSAARELPGYSLVAQVIGRDPITGEAVTVERSGLVELLLTYGPFGPAVSAVLEAAEVIGQVFDAISAGLEANRLTRQRVVDDIAAAFDEFTLSNGIAANLAIVRRYVNAFLTDLRNFIGQMADRVIEMVRAVVVDLAERLLESETIKPVWDLTKQVLHYDPLRGVPVEVPTVEILANFLRLIHEEDALEQMRERGTLEKTAKWLDEQAKTFLDLIAQLGALFSNAWAAIQPANLPNLLDTLPALASQAFALIQGVASFAATVGLKVLELVKQSLLGWLSRYAQEVPGFHLITVIIEKNPFTDEVVPRTAENLIKGFITLLPGGEAMYESLAESGVITDAATRIESEMTRLGITLELVTNTFLGVWNAVTLESLLTPVETFRRIVDLFGDPISRIFEFIRVVIEVVITLVLRLMNFPTELLSSIVANALAAIEDIKRDPVGFLVNILQALKAGFIAFFDHIGTYLMEGLTAWLFRGLGQIGITIPTQWTLASALDLVLQVLGLSVEFLWRKLGEHIGEERVAQIREAIGMLTGAWAFIRDVQERGLAAIWDYVVSQLSGLWDTVLSMAFEWVITRVIQAITARLISMLDPTGVMAVINGAIAFFDAVQSAIEYIREILEIINMYVMTFAAVAAGNIEPGAQMIERGLAAAIPVAIGFLANQVGLGNIPEKIVEIIQSLRQMVEQAIDWLIAQALRLGAAALNALGLGPAQEGEAPAGGGPKHQAQALLRTRVTGHEDPDELGRILGAIKTELAPAGLHDLALRGPDVEGQFEVVAAASEYTRLAAFVPALTGPRAVQMRVTLHTRPGEEPLAGATAIGEVRAARRGAGGQIETDESGAPVLETTHHELPPVIPHGARAGRQQAPASKTRFGGVALPPEPGEPRLELLTYNTSDNPRATDNTTHAERQLLEFVERNATVAGRVERIEAQINWSPCSLCSSTLSSVSALTPNATQRVIHWQTLYTHPTRGTTDQSLSAISGWVVDPRNTAGERAPEVDLQALTWPELPAEV